MRDRSAEEQKADALLKAHIDALERSAVGVPLKEIFTALALTIEEQASGQAVVSVFLIDRDGKRLRPAAAPSLPEAFNWAVDGIEIGSGLFPGAHAAAHAAVSIIPDIANAEGWDDLGPQFAAKGLKSAWSMPILSAQGHILGTIDTYFRECREPTDRERQIVELLCRTAALAIEQQAAQYATDRSQDRMQLAVRSAEVGVWYCPLPFDKLIWDDRVKAHFHLPPDAEVTIDTFYDRLHPEDRERTRAAIEQSITTRTYYDIDYRTVSADGQAMKWIRAVGRTFYDDLGNPIQFDGVTFDISHRKTIEENLKNTAAELQRHVDTLARLSEVNLTLASTTDTGEIVQKATDAATHATGAEFGAFFYNVVRPDGEQYMLYTLSGVPRSAFDKFPMPRNTAIFAPTFTGEGVVRSPDITKDPRYGKNTPRKGMPEGHLPVRSYLAVPVKTRSGEVIGGLFFGHSKVDVFDHESERFAVGLAAQAAIALDNARLYQNLRLSEEAERAARAAAERAGRMKDDFLATLSHELRTPLNAILGWTHLLRKGVDREHWERGIDVIERNARAQTQLISDLLDISRITAGKMRLDVQRVELPVVIEAALEAVRPAADAKGVRLQTVLEPIADAVHGDPGRLQQIIWNLISNAVKFTPRDGRVQVVLARVNSHVELQVSDSGQGIPPEFLPHLFERFTQADASSTREHTGLGLGLALVKQLVEMHGGRVKAASDGMGKGATFVVELPLAILHTTEEVPRVHPHSFAAPENVVKVGLQGLRLLVVDDEPDALEVTQQLLQAYGAKVMTALSADAAMALLQMERFDLLISDIGMPRKDGYAFIQDVRRSGHKLPAAALTAFARSEDRTQALLRGYQAHITKPVEPAELLATIVSLTGRSAQSGTP
jgi:signal transduction histidine kinase/PAS domain-containing protein/ActR/RegA family two-component response regulator